MNTKCNGHKYILETFSGIHQILFVTLQEASDRVNFQIFTEHSIVVLLIHNISNNDPDLCDAIASVLLNNNDTINDFESYAALILPVCSYSNHQTLNNTNNGHPQNFNVGLKYNHQIKNIVNIYCNTNKE